MEQPNDPTQKKKVPTPKELVSHYESQGMESQEASLKVIENLQKQLVGVISSGRGKDDKLLAECSRKMDAVSNGINYLYRNMDAVNSRITNLDKKMEALKDELESKPGCAATFAIGLASGFHLKILK